MAKILKNFHDYRFKKFSKRLQWFCQKRIFMNIYIYTFLGQNIEWRLQHWRKKTLEYNFRDYRVRVWLVTHTGRVSSNRVRSDQGRSGRFRTDQIRSGKVRFLKQPFSLRWVVRYKMFLIEGERQKTWPVCFARGKEIWENLDTDWLTYTTTYQKKVLGGHWYRN